MYATVSPEKAEIVKRFGAIPVDYLSTAVEQYVATATGGKGFDIVYGTMGGETRRRGETRPLLADASLRLGKVVIEMRGSIL